jgi:cytochrome c oxidase subunit 2
MKPMMPDNQQGMPNLNLDPATIDALVAYLVTLN